MRKTQFVAVVFLAFLCREVNSQVIVNVNMFFVATPTLSRFSLGASAFPEHGPTAPCAPVGCYSGAAFHYDGHSVTQLDSDLLWTPGWYIAEYGEPLNSLTPFNGQPEPVEVGTGDFYAGVRIPDIDTPFGYGWAHLRSVNGVLTMVENVMAYGLPGIVVGTTHILPEQATAVGVATSLPLIFFRWSFRRRNRSSVISW
jgi:hypothetical protein